MNGLIALFFEAVIAGAGFMTGVTAFFVALVVWHKRSERKEAERAAAKRARTDAALGVAASARIRSLASRQDSGLRFVARRDTNAN